jgi:streptogramin lyase
MRSKLVMLSSVLLAMLVAGGILFFALHSTFAATTAHDYFVASGIDPWGTAFDKQGNVWVAIPGCDPTPTCSTSTPPGKIEVFNPTTLSWTATYQLPAGYGQALFLAFDAQGNVWFPMPMSNSIGRLNPTTKVFQQWTVPTANAGPWGIAIDHKGLIWFTEHFTNKIGRFNPSTHVFKEFTTPSANSQPYGIAVDKANNIWFTENNPAVARIGEYKAASKQLLEYTIRANPPSGLTPHLLTLDPNGNVWWSEGFVAMIGELKVAQASPGTNKGVKEYAYPLSCSNCGTHTSGISVDSKGLVWFDDSLQSIYGSFPDSGTGSFATYATPTANSHPHDGLRVDSQNRIWFDEEFQNKLAVATQ